MIAIPAYKKGVDVSKSNAVDFVNQAGQGILCDAIFVGGAGVVAVVWEDGSVSELTATAGQILPVKARRVNNTNTTATLMVALYTL